MNYDNPFKGVISILEGFNFFYASHGITPSPSGRAIIMHAPKVSHFMIN